MILQHCLYNTHAMHTLGLATEYGGAGWECLLTALLLLPRNQILSIAFLYSEVIEEW